MDAAESRVALAIEAALLLKRVQHQKNMALDAVLVQEGSSMSQWNALRSIAENPDSTSHGLAVLAFKTDQSFGALLGKLADLGLVERVPGARKSLTHSLTPQGESLLAASTPVVQEELERQLAPLSDHELNTLVELLTKLAEGSGAA